MYAKLLYLVSTIFLAAAVVGSARDDQKIKISVWQWNSDTVRIQWQSAYKKLIRFCEVRIEPYHGSSMNVIFNYIPSKSGFELNSLKPSTKYTVFIICHDGNKNQYSSNKLTFTTASDKHFHTYKPPDEYHANGSSKFSDTPQVYRERLATNASTLDIALGVVFSLFGVIIIVSVAFYLWRKYQRRQRIRRFIRHQDSNSFPDLSSMYSNSDLHQASQSQQVFI